jgi:hypothetical protein
MRLRSAEHTALGDRQSILEAIAVAVRFPDSSMRREIMAEYPDAPLDRTAGEVLVACQRHFVIFPPDVVFEVRVREPSGAEVMTRYAVPHVVAR